MEYSQEVIPVKKRVVWILVLMAMLFMVLSFVPGNRQGHVFPYSKLCDYRTFILPTIKSSTPYEPDKIYARDACYPPIAYCTVRALSTDRGEKWRLTNGEIRLLLSILVMQLLGTFLLTWKIPDVNMRIAAFLAITASPACICSILRGNPSGWAFAFVCAFICWRKSDSKWLRLVAALSLGAATALKVTPCLFGALYISDAFRSHRRIQVVEIVVAVLAALALMFVPFLFLGGLDSIPRWVANALANAEHYSVKSPIWGLVGLANGLIDAPSGQLPGGVGFALATRILSAMLVMTSLFTQQCYRKLLFIGAAMAFVTHHDYGGAYLIPAFVAWLRDSEIQHSSRSAVWLLLEAVSWCVIMTPLQVPNPYRAGTMNAMLQNEFLFVLLISAFQNCLTSIQSKCYNVCRHGR